MRPGLREHDPRPERTRSSGGRRVYEFVRLVVVAGLLASVGCGYSLVSTGKLTGLAGERGIVVGDVDNRTAEPEAGLIAARFAGRGLAARGVLGRAPGALELRIRVDALDAQPAGSGGFSSSLGLPQRVPLWKAEGYLSLKLVDTSEHPARLVASSSARGSEEYRPGDDIEATEVSRSLALHRLTESLVFRALDELSAP